MLLSWGCIIKKKFKLAGPLVFYSGSNECSLAPQFKWMDNTFKEAKPMRISIRILVRLCRHKKWILIQNTGRKLIFPFSLRFCLQLTLRDCGRPLSTKKASSPTFSGAQVLPLHLGIVLMPIRIGLTNYDDDPVHDPTPSFTHENQQKFLTFIQRKGSLHCFTVLANSVVDPETFFRIRILLFSWFRIRILFGSYMIFFLYSYLCIPVLRLESVLGCTFWRDISYLGK